MKYSAALITGGAQRLGRSMALALAARGVDVAVHYSSSATEAEQTVSDLQGLGVKAIALQSDLLIEAEMQTLVERASDALNKTLDILVNNASIFEYDNLASADLESWNRHMGSNLRAPFVLSQCFAAQAPKADTDESGEPMARACIVNMVDQRVRKLTPEFMTYTLAKSALWTLTQTSAQALAPDIRVNAIGPGPTWQGYRQSKEHFDKQRSATVLGRGAGPDDITATLNFLLDSTALTGQLLCVDGGQHLIWRARDVLGVE